MSAYPHILVKRAQGNVVEWKRITQSSVWLCLPRCALLLRHEQASSRGLGRKNKTKFILHFGHLEAMPWAFDIAPRLGVMPYMSNGFVPCPVLYD
jgi:hypothetical protein